VHDAFRVGCIQGVGDLNPQLQHFLGLEGPAGEPVFQGLAFQKLHNQEGSSLMVADVVDGADVGMVQGRRGAGLPLEAIQCLLVFGILLRQELQGDVAAESGVLGLVDHTHAAGPELFQDAVVGDGAAGHALALPFDLPDSLHLHGKRGGFRQVRQPPITMEGLDGVESEFPARR